MRKRSIATGLAVACTAALAVAAGGGAAVAAPTTYPTAGASVPDQDPFYAAPGNLGTFGNGALVRSRPVGAGSFSAGTATDAWQLAYRTNDSHNRAELAVTTLLVPKSPWLGTGARPAVSLESPEDSTGTQCAPSYLIATNGDSQDELLGADLLLAGYAVALPDHEGPNSVFLAGPEEGHAVLDGIRAVRHFKQDGIGTANPWALSGYSGGANAAGWAAQLQPSYARELPLVGAAIGGTPSDPTAVARYIDGGLFSGFEFAAAESVATEWPEAGIDKVLNAAGKAAFADVKGKCESYLLSTYGNKKLATYSTAPDPLVVPSVAKILKLDTLGKTAPSIPIYDYHADTDEIVPVAQDNTLVSTWCGKGAKVVRVRDAVGEHVEEAAVREASVLAWLTARFQNLPVTTSTC